MRKRDMEQLNNTIGMVGDVELTLRDAAGNIKHQLEVKNLVVSGGKNWIASRMAGASDPVMSHMAIGTGSITPSAGNTTLVAEVGRVALTSTLRTNSLVTYSAFFAAGVGTGGIQEAAIFNGSSVGTMLCRTVFATINKDSLDTLTINWTVTVI